MKKKIDKQIFDARQKLRQTSFVGNWQKQASCLN